MSIGHNGGPPLGHDGGWVAIARTMRTHEVVGFHLHATPADANRGAMQPALAWIDLIMECRYASGTVNNNGRLMTIQRGQLVGATSWLAARWNWTPKAVRGWLAKLEAAGMISFEMPAVDQIANQKTGETTQGANQVEAGSKSVRSTSRSKGRFANIISICNYSLYQMGDRDQGQVDGQVGGQDEGRLRAGCGQVEGRLTYIENARARTKKQITREEEKIKSPLSRARGDDLGREGDGESGRGEEVATHQPPAADVLASAAQPPASDAGRLSTPAPPQPSHPPSHGSQDPGPLSPEPLSDMILRDVMGWMSAPRSNAAEWVATSVGIYGQDAFVKAYQRIKTDIASGSIVAKPLPAISRAAERIKAAALAACVVDPDCWVDGDRVMVANGFESELLRAVGDNADALRSTLDKAAASIDLNLRGNALRAKVRAQFLRQAGWDRQDERRASAVERRQQGFGAPPPSAAANPTGQTLAQRLTQHLAHVDDTENRRRGQ